MEPHSMKSKEELVRDILRLKGEKNALLLVHNYQLPEIQDIADVLGDSLDLSRKAARAEESVIVFCGVRFMAETAKILSPQKTVLLPRRDAGCPMADTIDVEGLKNLKSLHPNAKVVTYVNSTAEVKAESHVCCTSANAVKVVQNVDADEIIFTPDRNLAAWVRRFTAKTVIPWQGFCYVHEQFRKEEVESARRAHPGALLLVHPECPPEITDMADEVLSTSGMLRFAADSRERSFLIATEEGLIYRLKKENPGKEFHSAGPARTCLNMKKTRLADVAAALENNRYPMHVPEPVASKARQALEAMLAYA
jgi:quinolinate synthase